MLSIILLSFNSNERLKKAFLKLSSILTSNNIRFELIIIDDGSSDNSFEIAQRLEAKHLNVKSFQLSKNYTSHYAIFAGLSVCSGKCAIPIPDDEQQPYDSIVDMYKLWKDGHKVIIPYRTKRNDGFLNNLFANLFYKIINAVSDIKFPPGGADIFFIDREIIDILNNRIHPLNTSSISEVLRLGYSPYFYPYDRVEGINQKSRWTFKKKFKLFKDTFFSCSIWPIRLITWFGIFFSVISFFIILIYSYVAIWGNTDFWGEKLPGWTSTVVIISFFSGLILFSLGIIAEYIWRIYEDVKDRPGFIIKKDNL